MKPSRLVTSGGVRHHTGRGMKKITKAALVGGAAAAAIAATVGLASPAQADSYSYIYRIENNDLVNFTGSKQWYLGAGHAICADLREGLSTRGAIDALYVYSNAAGYDFNYTASEEVVYVAKEELC